MKNMKHAHQRFEGLEARMCSKLLTFANLAQQRTNLLNHDVMLTGSLPNAPEGPTAKNTLQNAPKRA